MSLKRAFIIKEAFEPPKSIDGSSYDPAKLDALARRLAVIIYEYENGSDRGDYLAMQVIEACQEAGVEPCPPDEEGDVEGNESPPGYKPPGAGEQF